jgi:hypothetical protein
MDPYEVDSLTPAHPETAPSKFPLSAFRKKIKYQRKKLISDS